MSRPEESRSKACCSWYSISSNSPLARPTDRFAGIRGVAQRWGSDRPVEYEPMSFCDHCDGQRFDRSRLLRILRRHLRECAPSVGGSEALAKAIEEIRLLDIPHLDRFEDVVDGEVVH